MTRIWKHSLVLAAILSSACAMSDAASKKAAYHLQMGLSFLGENNPTTALIELSEAEKLTPDDPQMLNYMGLAYYYKKKYDLAEQKYLKAIRLKPNFSDARNNLGVVYLEMKRWDDAITQFTYTTEDIFYPSPESAQINLGLAYFGKGDTIKALSIMRSLVSNNPKIPQGRPNLGRIYFAVDKIDLAIAEYKAALELNSNYVDAHFNLGIAYQKLKDNGAAAASFREVVRISPESEAGQLAKEYLDLMK